jgi:hypothetical protein
MRRAILLAALVLAAPAQAAVYKCPPAPATYADSQSIADGWQVWVEGAKQAAIERWSNGVVFFHPAVGSAPPSVELQCLATAKVEGGQVPVEARKSFDRRMRCTFDKVAQSFDCR